MEQNSLVHYGIPGMKWGVRRTSEQLGRKNAKLEKKVVNYERRAAKYAKQQAYYARKNAKMVNKVLYGFSNSKRDYRRGRKYARRLARATTKSASYQAKAARAKKQIYKNQNLIKAMETKMSSIPKEQIAAGKEYVDNLRGD